MRGYLTAWVSMCWGAGSFLATGVLRGSLNLKGDAGWRVPYGLQWVWVPPLLLVGFLAPESPWYLIRRNRIEDAEKSLALGCPLSRSPCALTEPTATTTARRRRSPPPRPSRTSSEPRRLLGRRSPPCTRSDWLISSHRDNGRKSTCWRR
ncbi:hypothetical protein BN1723_013451 [Verticillium longisporum]|uniref:Major facilitator superfamily (MFS) profile domain-containing protein n=1 Tax=Verticillium longisporum TaxID=100787 RepID=A0A0G4LSN2_VERLO|nr:hypothetical protein BN1723_013451 [Verticillium longisporum]